MSHLSLASSGFCPSLTHTGVLPLPADFQAGKGPLLSPCLGIKHAVPFLELCWDLPSSLFEHCKLGRQVLGSQLQTLTLRPSLMHVKWATHRNTGGRRNLRGQGQIPAIADLRTGAIGVSFSSHLSHLLKSRAVPEQELVNSQRL